MSKVAEYGFFEELVPCTRSLFSVSSREIPEFHGSGLFTRVSDRLYLITARHVLKEWREAVPLCFDRGPNEQIRQLEGSEYFVRDSTGKEVDAAVVQLSVRASAEINEALVVPISLLKDEANAHDESRYAVAGYPVATNRDAVARENPEITPSLYGVVTTAAVDLDLSRLHKSPSDYLALNWNRKAAYSFEGRKLPGPKLHGLSGAPIWRIGGDQPFVAGILIEHHQGNSKIIVGVRSHLILRAIGL